MPYIAAERRPLYDELIEKLVAQLRLAEAHRINGDANYIVSRIVAGALRPEAGWGYDSASDATKTLTEAAEEMRRRLLAEYEDKTILRNGDIPEYEKGV